MEIKNGAIAVISCGEGNKYGHPHDEVMDRLEKKGVTVYRTDTQGTIVLISASAVLVMLATVFMITRKKMSIYED